MTPDNYLDVLMQLEADLSTKSPLKVDGDATHYRGTTIHQDRAAGTILLGQATYIRDVVAPASQENASSVSDSSPIAPGAHLGCEFCPTTDEEKEDMRNVPYRAVVGSLLWIANGTRPDIACATSLLLQFLPFMSCQEITHL
jgi:hypothetical protein